MKELSPEATKAVKITPQSLIWSLPSPERRGLQTLVISSQDDKTLELPDEIVAVRSMLATGFTAINEGRGKTLEAISRLYAMIVQACRSESSMAELCIALERPKMRSRKPFNAVVKAIFGPERRRASKHAQLLRLGFHEALYPHKFIARVEELGGIEKALRHYSALTRRKPENVPGRATDPKEIASVDAGSNSRSASSASDSDQANEVEDEETTGNYWRSQEEDCSAQQGHRGHSRPGHKVVAAIKSTVDKQLQNRPDDQCADIKLSAASKQRLFKFRKRAEFRGKPVSLKASVKVMPDGQVRVFNLKNKAPKMGKLALSD